MYSIAYKPTANTDEFLKRTNDPPTYDPLQTKETYEETYSPASPTQEEPTVIVTKQRPSSTPFFKPKTYWMQRYYQEMKEETQEETKE